jgi:hypothetical protein
MEYKPGTAKAIARSYQASSVILSASQSYFFGHFDESLAHCAACSFCIRSKFCLARPSARRACSLWPSKIRLPMVGALDIVAVNALVTLIKGFKSIFSFETSVYQVFVHAPENCGVPIPRLAPTKMFFEESIGHPETPQDRPSESETPPNSFIPMFPLTKPPWNCVSPPKKYPPPPLHRRQYLHRLPRSHMLPR